MKLELLIIHCTATPALRPVYKQDIIRWHTTPVEQGGRGWKQVGYSDMILLDGSIVNLVPYDDDQEVDPWEVTNGVAGINRKSRHVVYVGGLDYSGTKAKDTRTPQQLNAMTHYVLETILKHPNIKIAGHNQFANKACPSFYVPEWLRIIDVDEKNIYENAPIA